MAKGTVPAKGKEQEAKEFYHFGFIYFGVDIHFLTPHYSAKPSGETGLCLAWC